MANQQTMEEFSKVIQGLMNQDNNTRKQAEEFYGNYVKSNPSLVAQFLLNFTCNASDVALKTFSPVLLRKLVSTKESLGLLDTTTLLAIQNQLPVALQSEQNSSVRRKICHVIANVASSYEQAKVSLEQKWPQLLQITLALSSNNDSSMRETGLYLLAQIGEYAPEFLQRSKQHIFGTLSNVFTAASSNNNALTLDGKVYLTQATINFMLSLDEANLGQCEAVMSPLLNTLSQLLQAGEELNAQDAMKSLMDLACNESVVKYMPTGVTTLSEAMLQVASTTSFDAKTRQIALELITSLGDIAPGAMRKRGAFVMQLVKCCIDMMAEEGDCDDEFKANTYTKYTESETDQDSMLGSAVDALHRLCLKLGGKAVLPSIFGNGPRLIADVQNWRNRRAGILAISTTCEGAKKMLLPQLPKLFQMLLPLIQNDSDQRVRYFAIAAVAQIIETFDGKVQANLHGEIIPIIGAALYPQSQSGNCCRVRATGATCVLSFANPEKCPSSSLLPYLDPLLNGLFSILNETNVDPSVQEEVIEAISVVAKVSGEAFGKFYDGFMPAAKGIIASATAVEYQKLRGKTMDCVGLIGIAVGKDKFSKDAKEVLEMILTVQANSTSTTDAALDYIVPACARICRAIGEEFLPYLQYVIPPLVQKAMSKTDCQITDVLDNEVDTTNSEEDAKNGISSTVLQIKGMENKRITLNTNDVFEKEVAIRALYDYLDVLEHNMAQYIEVITKAVVPLMVYKYAPTIREVAVLMMPRLINAASVAIKKNLLPANNALIGNLLGFMLPNFMSQLEKEVNMEVLCATGEGMKLLLQTLYESGGYDDARTLRAPVYKMPLNMTLKLTEGVCAAAKLSANRRINAMKEAAEKGFEAEDYEQLEEDLEDEEEFMTNLVDSCGYMLKSHKSDFLPAFDAFVGVTFAPLLQMQNPATLRHNAMCVFDDVVEHCGQGSYKYLDLMLGAAFQYAQDPKGWMRQAAVYGIRIAAEKAPSQFAPKAAEALNLLAALVTAPNSKTDDNINATENAIAAIGTICKYHSNASGVNLQNALPIWFSNLPLVEDEECAQLAALHLCDFLQSDTSSTLLLGNQYQNAPHLLSTMSQMILGGNGGGDTDIELAAPATKQTLEQLLLHIVPRLPENVRNSSFQSLSEHQKQYLQSKF